ncbi:MAG: ABC transporter ATP-binding protein/permease, partial [Rickettsiales bacterium]|nr:ABC transporter ATP-binding protein/permease [Rickettsiales bacterium]
MARSMGVADGSSSKKSLILRVLKEGVYPYKFRLLSVMAFMLLSAAAVAYRAYLIKPAVDRVFVSKNIIDLYMIPLKLTIVAVICCLSTYLQNLLMSNTCGRIRMDLQVKLFSKLLGKDIDFYQKQSSGRIGTYLNDASGMSEIVDVVLNGFLLQVFTIIFLVSVMIYQNPRLSIVSLTAFPVVIFPIISIGKKTKDLADNSRERLADVTSAMTESFNNIKVIKSNNKELEEVSRLDSLFSRIHKTSMALAKKSLFISPLMEMISMIAFALVIFYSGNSIVSGTVSAGDFFTFVTAMFSAYKPAKSITGLSIQFQNALSCVRRYFALMDQKNRIVESENPAVLSSVEGNIKFNKVSFYYPRSIPPDGIYEFWNDSEKLSEQPALSDINLNITAGKSYALVGHSGSGKTTIFNLILRFYDASSGSITIDNVDVRDLSFSTLRGNISVVDQDVKLFDASILENIRYTKSNATQEEVIDVAKMANVDEFVRNMPHGYRTIIGHDGTLLS